MTHPMLEWYEAQLAEDERIARAAAELAPGPWSYNDEGDVNSSDGEEVLPTDGGYYGQGEAVAAFIAGHDPTAALRDIAVKRSILFYHSGNHECSGPDDNCMWIDDDVCPTVRALVSAFAARDGYDPSWAPQ